MIINKTSKMKKEMDKLFHEKYANIVNDHNESMYTKTIKLGKLISSYNYFEKCTFEEYVYAHTKSITVPEKPGLGTALTHTLLLVRHAGIKLPRKGTENSAGYDFYICEDIKLEPGEKYMYITGIIVYLQKDKELSLLARSSSDAVIYQGEGVIDSDFSNSIVEVDGVEYRKGIIRIPFYNNKNKTIYIKSGTYDMQGLIRDYHDVIDPIILNKDRDGGFGSTNTK